MNSKTYSIPCFMMGLAFMALSSKSAGIPSFSTASAISAGLFFLAGLSMVTDEKVQGDPRNHPFNSQAYQDYTKAVQKTIGFNGYEVEIQSFKEKMGKEERRMKKVINTCDKCHKPFDGQDAHLFEEKGKIYHTKCIPKVASKTAKKK